MTTQTPSGFPSVPTEDDLPPDPVDGEFCWVQTNGGELWIYSASNHAWIFPPVVGQTTVIPGRIRRVTPMDINTNDR